MREDFTGSKTQRFSLYRFGFTTLICGTAVAAVIFLLALSAAAAEKPRLVVLTDIGGDPDDQQSLVRLMVYANEFDIEGLVASASGTPGELKEQVTKPHLVREIVEAYGKVRDNLALHAAGYLSASHLLSVVKSGNPMRGLDAIGEGRDTEGSNWILRRVEKEDPRPLNIAIWGGQTDLAQALWRVRKDHGSEGVKRFAARTRIYDIADQDGIADWILEQFPGLFYVLNQAPKGRDKREAAFRGMYLGGEESLTSRDWMETHIRKDHGPLGLLYPTKTWTAPNPHSAIKEGDTPSWFYFLPNGLNDPGHPEWGSWGGRFQRGPDGVYRDARDTVGKVTDARATVWRWRPAFQNDFQARMDWCVKPFAEANHAPSAVLNGDASRAVLRRVAKPGEEIALSAGGTKDPDGNRLAFKWWVYREAGTCGAGPSIEDDASATARVKIPTDAKGKTIHVILEVTDGGQPALTACRRMVIEVK